MSQTKKEKNMKDKWIIEYVSKPLDKDTEVALLLGYRKENEHIYNT